MALALDMNNNDTPVHSGKSTQVPQFLAEELLQGNHGYGSVICTQVIQYADR